MHQGERPKHRRGDRPERQLARRLGLWRREKLGLFIACESGRGKWRLEKKIEKCTGGRQWRQVKFSAFGAKAEKFRT